MFFLILNFFQLYWDMIDIIYVFKVYRVMTWHNLYITKWLLHHSFNISIMSHNCHFFLRWRHLKFIFSNFQVYYTMLWIIITMLYILRTYLFYKWKFVTFNQHLPISPSPRSCGFYPSFMLSCMLPWSIFIYNVI